MVGLVLSGSAVACGGSIDGSPSPADGEATPGRAAPADGVGSAADGSGEDSANGVAQPARLCDGSDETRLALVQYGGFGSIVGGFSELNGS